MMTRQWKRTGWKYSLLVAVVGLAVGCGIGAEGEEGNLAFEYVDTEGLRLAGGTDLAVGSTVDVEVTHAEDDDRELELIEAFSEDAQTLEVSDSSSRQFRLQALEASSEEGTTIHAEVQDSDGEELSDHVSIRTAEAAEVEFSEQGSTCRNDAVYLTEADVTFNYLMRDAEGDRLSGYGYYPVAVEPEQGGSIDDNHSVPEELAIETGSEPARYELSPGDEVDGSPLEFELVDPDDVDELSPVEDEELDQLEASFADAVDTPAGPFGMIAVRIEADERTVCGRADTIIDVESVSDSEMCQDSGMFAIGYDGYQVVLIDAPETGECEIELSVIKGELSEKFTVEVRE